MAEHIGVAEAKARFSELVNRASYGKERFVIERRGKPVGAIVSAADLEQLENGAKKPRPRGLRAIVGAMADFPEYDEIMQEVVRSRAERFDNRQVDLE